MPVFCGKSIRPTPRKAVEIPMETLFKHLTTEMVNKVTRERVFEIDRSMRLHRVRFHINQSGDAYYLLSAYYIKGKDAQRSKIEKKYKRKLEVLH